MRISKNGNYALVDTGTFLFSAEISATDRTPSTGVQPYFTGTGTTPMQMGEFSIVPYGDQNTLPGDIRTILDENNVSPEILLKKTHLLWGQGPELYELKFENGIRKKVWVTDNEISAWLKDWDYQGYLLKTLVEFEHVNGHFPKYFRNRAARIGGKPMIAKLDCVSAIGARLEWPDDNGSINHIITGDFEQPFRNEFKQYPIWDPRDPFRNPVSMRYSNMYSFALENEYARPSFFGLFNWIKLGSSLPILLLNFNANAAAIRYHIEVPALYWAQKEEQLKKNCELTGVLYTSSLLEDLKTEVFLKFGEALIGIEKAGKMITSETIYDELAQEYVGWKINTIDQKVKNFISAQIDIAKRADFEITAGFGLHPALSNMSADGNLPSGSEQLYAFKLYLATSVDIPESIVCKDINLAIAANWPDKSVRVGFYHDAVLTESQTSPGDRIKNN